MLSFTNLFVSGKRRVLDCTTEFIAMHKNRSIFPVKLTVTHLSGVGEDCIFMGVIEVQTGTCVGGKDWH